MRSWYRRGAASAVLLVAACTSPELTFGELHQMQLLMNAYPQGIDLETDMPGGEFECDYPGVIYDGIAGSTYSRLADAGPVATLADITAPPSDFVVVESVPLAVGEGYVVRAADGCPARLRVDAVHPDDGGSNAGSAVDVSYEHANCATVTLDITTVDSGSQQCPPNYTLIPPPAIHVVQDSWPDMDLPVAQPTLRLPIGAHASLTADGRFAWSVDWSAPCGGSGCDLDVDGDITLSVQMSGVGACMPPPDE